MSFTDRLVLWLHIGFAIFTIGPVAVAISSTPRYLRKHDLPVVRYLARITIIFTIASLAVLIMGIVAAQQGNDFSRPWLTVSMTLFVVALVLLVLIIRDQRKAIGSLEGASAVAVAVAASAAAAPAAASPDPEADTASEPAAATAGEPAPAAAAATTPARPAAVASVERGRIAMMGGVVNLIWLVILVLMIWNA
ncbi:MAG: hypothetical protein ACLQDY_11500 [Streptosporangiaceae bacterium]